MLRKGNPSVGGNIHLCSYYGKQYGDPKKYIKNRLPYDPAIPLLGIYLKKTKTLIRKGICTSMFIAALFPISKI